MIRPQAVSYFPRPVKGSRQESDEIVELQRAIKIGAFVQFIADASDVLERYQKYLDRNVESDPNTCKRCAELEFHNEDLQKKCKYMSSKIKSLESTIKQGNLDREEEHEFQSAMVIESPPVEHEIELSNEPMIAATEPFETNEKLLTTFTCAYCNHEFVRKFNLKTHMATCKEKIAILPEQKTKLKNKRPKTSAGKQAMVCKICKKEMPNRRKLLTHLWSIIKDWDKRKARGKHGEMSREQHQEYRQSVLRN